MKNQKGFSLIELLIVVVIIGIIAAIAIPNLLASRRSANEGSAVSSLRTYHGAQATYQATTGAGSYAGASGNAFIELSAIGLLDTNFSSGVKSGYGFNGASLPASAGSPACHAGYGQPMIMSGVTQTGTRTFIIATQGVINSAAVGTYSSPTGTTVCDPNSSFNPIIN